MIMGSAHHDRDEEATKRALLLKLIDRLEPEKEMFAGIRFLRTLLQDHGVEACTAFLDKATKALSEEDGLDLAFDFTPIEKAIFDSVQINYLSRRNFLQTAGWSIPGAVTFSHAGTSIAEKIMNQPVSAPKPHSRIAQTQAIIENYLLPPSELLIGAALMNEGYEKSLEIKLEQIADAVSELSEKIRLEKKQNCRNRS